ncbi:MAG: TIGR03435 family protein, partial [Terriglobales bacterium]
AFGPQAAAAPTSFDAFTIKPAPPPEMRSIRFSNRVDPTRITIENSTLQNIIQSAFELQPYQLAAPDWLQVERFDITAVTAAPATAPQMHKLLQALLTQQFQLKFHRESKLMDAYALRVADHGSKLKPPGPNGALRKGKMSLNIGGPGGLSNMTLRGNLDMGDFAALLTRQLGKPVLDRTGISGDYAISLTYASPSGARQRILSPALSAALQTMAQASAQASAPDVTAAAEPAPSLFTALQQQLGLKLESKKLPVDILVVDSAAKSPISQ